MPDKSEIYKAAKCAVADAEAGRPSLYNGPGTAAYLGVRAVLLRHLERVDQCAPDEEAPNGKE